MTTTLLRGRAASPIRPGLIVKKVLAGELPLDTGEIVSEAAITDLFKAYKAELEKVNALRPKNKRIKGMVYSSFYTMFRFAQLKGLVKLTRTEEADYYRKTKITTQTTLLRVEKGVRGASKVVVSNRRIFKLTEIGIADEVCWADLTKSWKENIEPGQKLEYTAPEPKIEKVKERVKKIKEAIHAPAPEIQQFTPYVWKAAMTTKNLNSLIEHLQILEALGLSSPGVSKEASILSSRLGDWAIDAEDKLDDAKSISNKAGIERYTKIMNTINKASEVLEDGNITGTIALLKEI